MEYLNSINYPYLIVQLLIGILYLSLIVITLRSIYGLQMSNWLKAAWVLVVIFVPLLGMLAYWLVGRRYDYVSDTTT